MTSADDTPREAFLRYMDMSLVGLTRPDLTAVNNLRSIADAWMAQGRVHLFDGYEYLLISG
jgi:hypothetical protein